MEVKEASASYLPTTGYKQTEVGVIPEDWEVTKLGKHATFRTGPFGSALHQSDYVDSGVPVINPMQIVDGKIQPTPSMAIPEQAARKLSEFRLSAGNVVIGRRGEMGRCAFVRTEEHGWLCGTGSMIIRTEPSLDARFIQRVLSSPPIIAEIENASVGSTMINLNQGTLGNLLVPLPPTRAEQEAIAEALSDADALIESLEQLLAKKRHLKQGAMQQLLTGKMRLPGFSGEWEVKRLGDLFTFSGGYSASRDQLSTEGHCYLHYGDIHKSSKTFIDVRAEYQDIPKLDIPLKSVAANSLLDDGDVVFVDASEDDEGTSKHVVIMNREKKPFISGLHTIVAKSNTDELAHEYRRYCFQTPAIRQQFLFYAVGTKVSGISKTNIAKITLPVPSVPEQTAIATILSDMDAEITALEAKLAKARAIKQGMMQELLTGRIRLV
jgi:type I restriction enzyme, S subunit